jgi:hypothetical protein
MNEGILHPLWDWLADLAISILALLPVIGLTVWLVTKLGGDVVLVFLFAGGIFTACHLGIKLFAHRVLVRICQNVALKFTPKFRQSEAGAYFVIFSKAMCLGGFLSLLGIILTFYLQTTAGGNDLSLDENLRITREYTTGMLLASIPFTLIGLIYLGKIKPILPQPTKTKIIAGQSGDIEGKTVRPKHAPPPIKVEQSENIEEKTVRPKNTLPPL